MIVTRDIEALQRKEFEVVIVGAGVSGAFLAWELSRRGVSVALLEQGDFGGYTSASSSKILHGGIRYLQQLKFSKVYESARERARFINFAPHIPKNIPFVVPTYNSGLMKRRLALQAGMALYDLLCIIPNAKIYQQTKKVLKGFYLKKASLINEIPLFRDLPGLTGGQFFYEAHMHSSERMTLELVKQAALNGAEVENYMRVEAFKREDAKVTGVSCKDLLSGALLEVKAKIVVNAAGPYIPKLSESLGTQLEKPTTAYSKGMHLVTRELDPKYAMALVTRMKSEALVSRGGRHIFIIPWRGRSLIGTTNEPFESSDLDNIPITEKEIETFIDEINSALPKAGLSREDVYYAYSGLYPLISEEVQTDTYQGTGEYQIVDHAELDKVEGVVSMMGAKYTTAGKVANKALEIILAKLNRHRDLNQELGEVPDHWQENDCAELVLTLMRKHGDSLGVEVVDHLVRNYGFAAESIIQKVKSKPELGQKFSSERENILAELNYCIEEEWVRHLDDFIFRRTGLGTIGHPGEDCLTYCVETLGAHFQWTDEECAAELARVEKRYCYEA